MSARVNIARTLACLTPALLLSACGIFSKHTTPEKPASAPSASSAAPAPATPGPTSSKKAGAYYMDDGPGDHPPPNIDAIPDAVPKAEPLRAAANKPYAVFGKDYTPQTSLKPYKQRGVASWYGRKFNGAQTSSGEIYDMYGMTAAHPTLPIPSYAKVTNLANSRSVVVRVNDRGPFLSERIMDLSYAAAYKLGYVKAGSAQVEVESIDPARFVPSSTAKNNAVPADISVAAPAKTLAPQAPVQTAVIETAAPVSAPPPGAIILPVSVEASGVYLQLGAFSQRDNAEAFRTRIYQRLDWLNDPINVKSGDGLYRLHLGPYRDRAEAERMAQRIHDALELTPTVVIK